MPSSAPFSRKRKVSGGSVCFKPLALLTAILHLISSALPWSPGLNAAPLERAALTAEAELPPPFSDFNSDFGTIREVYFPDNPEAPFLFHVQDAHTNADAQENIRNILHFIHEKRTAEGPMHVALEGATGEVHPSYLDLFPAHPEINEAIVNTLASMGEITGAEMFAWDWYKKDKSSNEIIFYGAEQLSLYRKNLKAYRDLLIDQPQISELLNTTVQQYEIAQSRSFAPEVIKFIKERKRRKHGDYENSGWNGEAAKSPQMMSYILYLASECRKRLDVDLESRFEQIRFPNLSRMVYLEKSERKVNYNQFQDERRSLLSMLESDSEKVLLIRRIQKMETESNPRQLAEAVWEQVEAAKNYDRFREFWKFMAILVLRTEISADDLFHEVDILENWLSQQMLASEEEKELYFLMEDFRLFENLVLLRLTRSELDEILSRQNAVLAAGSGKRLQHLVERHSSLQGMGEMLPEIQSKLQAYALRALEFYQDARFRDEALLNTVLDRSLQAEPSVLITGGFHTQGVTEILKRQGVGYAVIQPGMKAYDEGNAYHRVMLNQNADLSRYLESGHLTKQEALYLKMIFEIGVPKLKETGNLSAEPLGKVVEETINEHPVLSKRVKAKSETGQSGETTIKLAFLERENWIPQSTSVPESQAVSNQILNQETEPYTDVYFHITDQELQDAATGLLSVSIPVEEGPIEWTFIPETYLEESPDRPEAREQPLAIDRSLVPEKRLAVFIGPNYDRLADFIAPRADVVRVVTPDLVTLYGEAITAADATEQARGITDIPQRRWDAIPEIIGLHRDPGQDHKIVLVYDEGVPFESRVRPLVQSLEEKGYQVRLYAFNHEELKRREGPPPRIWRTETAQQVQEEVHVKFPVLHDALEAKQKVEETATELLHYPFDNPNDTQVAERIWHSLLSNQFDVARQLISLFTTRADYLGPDFPKQKILEAEALLGELDHLLETFKSDVYKLVKAGPRQSYFADALENTRFQINHRQFHLAAFTLRELIRIVDERRNRKYLPQLYEALELIDEARSFSSTHLEPANQFENILSLVSGYDEWHAHLGRAVPSEMITWTEGQENRITHASIQGGVLRFEFESLTDTKAAVGILLRPQLDVSEQVRIGLQFDPSELAALPEMLLIRLNDTADIPVQEIPVHKNDIVAANGAISLPIYGNVDRVGYIHLIVNHDRKGIPDGKIVLKKLFFSDTLKEGTPEKAPFAAREFPDRLQIQYQPSAFFDETGNPIVAAPDVFRDDEGNSFPGRIAKAADYTHVLGVNAFQGPVSLADVDRIRISVSGDQIPDGFHLFFINAEARPENKALLRVDIPRDIPKTSDIPVAFEVPVTKDNFKSLPNYPRTGLIPEEFGKVHLTAIAIKPDDFLPENERSDHEKWRGDFSIHGVQWLPGNRPEARSLSVLNRIRPENPAPDFDFSTEAAEAAARRHMAVSELGEVTRLSETEQSTASRLGGFFTPAARLARNQNQPVETIINQTIQAILGENLYSELNPEVLELIRTHAAFILNEEQPPSQAIHLKSIADGREFQADIIESTLHALAIWAFARPTDRITIFITDEPYNFEDDVDTEAVELRYREILEALGAPSRLANRIQFLHVDGVQPTLLKRAIMQTSSRHDANVPVALIADNERLLQIYGYREYEALINKGKKFRSVDGLILTGTHLREKLVRQLQIIDLESFLDSMNLEGDARERIGRLVQALRKLTASA